MIKRKTFFKYLHYAIIVKFLMEIFYAPYIIFFVLKPAGKSGALFGAAESISMDLMMKRRLYAIEFWIAFSGLAIYLALTEFKSTNLIDKKQN